MPPFNLHALNLAIISPHSGVGQCVKERLVVVVQVAAASVWRVKRNVHLNVNSYRLWYTAILRHHCGIDVLLEFTACLADQVLTLQSALIRGAVVGIDRWGKRECQFQIVTPFDSSQETAF
nr:MAG TPA: hypothetical protein [Caudoviricetes sp.]